MRGEEWMWKRRNMTGESLKRREGLRERRGGKGVFEGRYRTGRMEEECRKDE